MLKLFKLFGVPVRAHWTFALLCVFLISALGGVVSAFVILCILAHEFGHILVARRYGYRTQAVTAMGLGMMAHIMGDMRRGEAVISFAGPLVNFVIAAVAWVFGTLFTLVAWSHMDVATYDYIVEMLWMLVIVNIALGAFNMLPIFPMDGGRVLRATLMRWYNRRRATRIAAWTGTVLALSLLPFAIMRTDIGLMIILPLVVLYSWTEVRRLERTGIEAGMM